MEESEQAAILRSMDQGKTFQTVEVPFRMGGNANGRGVGERLAIDPNDNNILYFGSRAAGLWISKDAALTWNQVNNFPPASAPAGPRAEAGAPGAAAGDAAAGARRGRGGRRRRRRQGRRGGIELRGVRSQHREHAAMRRKRFMSARRTAGTAICSAAPTRAKPGRRFPVSRPIFSPFMPASIRRAFSTWSMAMASVRAA